MNTLPRDPHAGAAPPVEAQRPSRPRRGFTLVEVVVAVAIAAILAALAFPSFTSQVRKSRRADAVLALGAVQQAQERWRANNPSYSGSLADLKVASTSRNGHYTIAILATPAPSGTGYSVEATAVAGSTQAGDTGCTTLRLDVSNGVASRPAAQESCWSK